MVGLVRVARKGGVFVLYPRGWIRWRGTQTVGLTGVAVIQKDTQLLRVFLKIVVDLCLQISKTA
jgi:hypothetical protein